jgi:hypothetical protein
VSSGEAERERRQAGYKAEQGGRGWRCCGTRTSSLPGAHLLACFDERSGEGRAGSARQNIEGAEPSVGGVALTGFLGVEIEVFIWGEGEGNKAIPGPSTIQGRKKASSKPVKHVYI